MRKKSYTNTRRERYIKKRQKIGILFACFLITVILLILTFLWYIRPWEQFVGRLTPFESNGKLSVDGMYLVNKDGVPFIMKGVSTMNIGSHKQFVTKEAFQIARDKWHVNTVRLSAATLTWDGYVHKENRDGILETLDKGIALADELGLYVIINWGIMSEQNPQYTQSMAIEFFTYFAEKYADHDNLIYEICNEPNGILGSWGNIKNYANVIIPLIRSFDKDAVIVVGTPEYSHELESVRSNPLTYDNIMYSYHFYAGTHKEDRRLELETSLEAGLPILVTEFSISTVDSDGTDAPEFLEGNRWISLLDKYQVGRVFFSLSNADQTNAMLKTDCVSMENWSVDDLTETGKWIVGIYLDDAHSYENNL